MFDWNDLRYFLAVARTGSTLAAGRALRVSQTTAARRVAALEQTVGLPLFERRQTGYFLTAAGEALITQGEAVEAAANAFTEAAGSQGREVSGTVRLTAQEIHAITVLAPMLRDLHEAHPAIRIELDTADAIRDLGAGAADIAIRTVDQPEGAGLVGRRIAVDHWAIYCSRDYAAAHGRPRRRRELRGHPFIGGGGDGVWKIYRAWLKANGLEDAVAMHHDSPTGLLSAVRSGIGLAVLPCFVADAEPGLIRCLPPAPGKERAIWLLTHERVRHTPRVRIVIDFLAEQMIRLARVQERGPALPLTPD